MARKGDEGSRIRHTPFLSISSFLSQLKSQIRTCSNYSETNRVNVRDTFGPVSARLKSSILLLVILFIKAVICLPSPAHHSKIKTTAASVPPAKAIEWMGSGLYCPWPKLPVPITDIPRQMHGRGRSCTEATELQKYY